MKKDLLFAQHIYLENYEDSYSYFFIEFNSFSVLLLTSFNHYRLLCAFLLILILFQYRSSFINQPLCYCLVYRHLKVRHKDWLSGTDKPAELCYTFSIWNNFTQMVDFLTKPLTVILTVPFFRISYFLLTLIFLLQWLFILWKILIMLLCPFPLTFSQPKSEILPFNGRLFLLLVRIMMVF